MSLVDDQDAVEEFAADRPDEALGDRIGPWWPHRSLMIFGWLYLVTVIDLATRMVIGWQLADHMRTSLVVDAVQMAITHGHVRPGGDLPQRPRRPVHLDRLRPVLRRS